MQIQWAILLLATGMLLVMFDFLQAWRPAVGLVIANHLRRALWLTALAHPPPRLDALKRVPGDLLLIWIGALPFVRSFFEWLLMEAAIVAMLIAGLVVFTRPDDVEAWFQRHAGGG